MKRSRIVLVGLFLLLGVAMIGCVQKDLPIEPGTTPLSVENGLENFSLPAGVTLESAILHIYVKEDATEYDDPNNEQVDIFRITAPWSELSVTWDNFGASYDDTDTIGTFIASPGWQTADVTSLVQMWMSGVENYGLLLKQAPEVTPWSLYNSREAGENTPYLSVTYSINGESHIVTLADSADSYIFERSGYTDMNYGSEEVLYTRYYIASIRDKQSLLKFEELHVMEGCETAYAYEDEYAHCFSEYDFNNWGWTNGPLGTGTYTFDIYAGAGQCDLSKGTQVGVLTVEYDGSTVTATYDLNSGNVLNEVHLYIGSDPIPTSKQGKETVAPGQYPYSDSDLNGASSYTFTEDGFSGPIYIIAHAVVCGTGSVDEE
ncbi:MAG: DNRLRE domain-containing protein [Calditrichota bacterium]